MTEAIAQHWVELFGGLVLAWLAREVLPFYFAHRKAGRLRSTDSGASVDRKSIGDAEVLEILLRLREQALAENDARPATRGDVRELRAVMTTETASMREDLAAHTAQDEERFSALNNRLDTLSGAA